MYQSQAIAAAATEHQLKISTPLINSLASINEGTLIRIAAIVAVVVTVVKIKVIVNWQRLQHYGCCFNKW